MEGYFLYDHGGSGNHGCEALVRTAVKLIGEPAALLFSENPEEERKYGIDQIVQVSPAMEPVSKADPAYWKAYFDLKIRHDYFPMDAVPYEKALSKAGRGLTGVSIGGDNYCYDYYPRFIRVHRSIAGRHPTVLLGCSMEKELFRDPEFIKDMKAYSLITARESVTYDLFREAGFERVCLAPDTAFLLESESMPWPEGFPAGRTIGINLSPLLVGRERVPGMVMENYRQLVRYILKETDFAVALIPHVVQRGNDDRTVLWELGREFMPSGRLFMVPDCDCRKLKGYIAGCRFLVAARTHASIAAYSSCVPALVTGYSTKAAGLARDLFGREEGYVLPVGEMTEPDRLKKAFVDLFDKEEEIRDGLRKRMPSYLEGFEELKKRLSQL